MHLQWYLLIQIQEWKIRAEKEDEERLFHYFVRTSITLWAQYVQKVWSWVIAEWICAELTPSSGRVSASCLRWPHAWWKQARGENIRGRSAKDSSWGDDSGAGEVGAKHRAANAWGPWRRQHIITVTWVGIYICERLKMNLGFRLKYMMLPIKTHARGDRLCIILLCGNGHRCDRGIEMDCNRGTLIRL